MTELSKKVITFGCRLNNLESELIDQQLKQHSRTIQKPFRNHSKKHSDTIQKPHKNNSNVSEWFLSGF